MPRLSLHVVLVASVLGVGGLAGAARAGATWSAGPAPARATGHDPARENAACEACHADVAAEWRSSLHHRAWDDPVFLTAYALEPLAFCRGCHVPEASVASPPSEGARRLGVGCVTCHVDAGDVVGVRHAPRATHPVRADATMAGAVACERCHQFDFPEPQPALMQSTANEHRASRYAKEPCQACHMPRVRDEAGRAHRSHDFRVIGNTALLRSAVRASARRTSATEIAVSLAVAGAGHDVPTGDLFRRVEVTAELVEDATIAARATLARRFVFQTGPHGPRRVQVGDDRLRGSGAPREVRLALPEGASGRAVRWSVIYRHMDVAMSAAFGIDPAADGVVLAEGTLPGAAKEPR